MTDVRLRMHLSMGNEIELLDGFYWEEKTRGYFSEFMRDMYDKRTEAKKKQDTRNFIQRNVEI
jgi:hypothetical protein